MLFQIFLFLVFVLRLYFCKYRKFAFCKNNFIQNEIVKLDYAYHNNRASNGDEREIKKITRRLLTNGMNFHVSHFIHKKTVNSLSIGKNVVYLHS